MPVTINGAGTIGGLGKITTFDTGGLPSGVILADTIAPSSFATTSDITGVTLPSGVITSGTAQLALSGTTNQGAIGSGFYVTGPGIPTGTIVVSGAGTFVLGLSQNANAVGLTPLAQARPYTFYKPNAVVSPGVLGGQLCRAWVNFNGTTVAGTSASGIRAAYNVSSITDNGTGDYTVNFTTAMPDANYSASISASGLFNGTVASTDGAGDGAPTPRTSSSFRFFTAGADGSGGSKGDPPYVNVAIFR